MRPIQRTRFAALCTLVFTFSACADEAPSTPRADLTPNATTTTAQLLQAIRDEIGDAACDNDQQCVSVAIGAKACGGPETYLAWSSKTGDRARLLALVTRHHEARLLEIQLSGMASNCSVVPNPGAVCRPRASDGKRVCQPGQGGQGRID